MPEFSSPVTRSRLPPAAEIWPALLARGRQVETEGHVKMVISDLQEKTMTASFSIASSRSAFVDLQRSQSSPCSEEFFSPFDRGSLGFLFCFVFELDSLKNCLHHLLVVREIGIREQSTDSVMLPSYPINCPVLLIGHVNRVLSDADENLCSSCSLGCGEQNTMVNPHIRASFLGHSRACFQAIDATDTTSSEPCWTKKRGDSGAPRCASEKRGASCSPSSGSL